MYEKCAHHDRIERMLSEQGKQLNENTQEISNIHKDITDVLPLQIDKAVGAHFTAYKAEKAVIRKEISEKEKADKKEKEKKEAEERALKNKWYKNQYLLIGALVTLINAAAEWLGRN